MLLIKRGERLKRAVNIDRLVVSRLADERHQTLRFTQCISANEMRLLGELFERA